ncbi:MAG: ZPR1 zinc finger domain-containing protein [Candidatus Woesearchaeota archaeon]
MEILKNQKCPMCHTESLTLIEDEKDVPFFGKVYIFSMDCQNENCKYHKADVEAKESGEPAKYTIEVSGEEDMKIRVVKSAEATVKIPHITTITPGPASNGYVTNIEGILNRVKKAIETAMNDSEDEDEKKKAKNMIKKLNRVMWGQEKVKITIEDPSGNSAIISDKAIKEKIKAKQKSSQL